MERTTPERIKDEVEDLTDELLPATEGSGPLLQRDYWAVIERCEPSPRELAELVAAHFWDFPPEELVRFRRSDGGDQPLDVGDEMDIDIVMAGGCKVRILHRDQNSITIGTLAGHPEAGRITFGAYRNEQGEVIFHIRSRARSGSETQYLGFVTAGEAMQTNTWTDFIDRLAHRVGDGVRGVIHAETQEIEDEPEEALHAPTFIAKGD